MPGDSLMPSVELPVPETISTCPLPPPDGRPWESPGSADRSTSLGRARHSTRSTNRHHAPTNDICSVGWLRGIAALRWYCETRGDTNVARQFRAHGVELGKWVVQCRESYWDGLLSTDQTRELAAVDGWYWGPRPPRSWRRGFRALERYAAEHATTVLVKPITIDTIDLHDWTAAQREAYATNSLAATRVELLEGLPQWEWDADQIRWRQAVTAATIYVWRHRTLASVRRETRLDGYPLGNWIQRRREEYRAGSMSTERVTELEALPGWSWQQPWDTALSVLRRYVAETGHACPAANTVIDGYRLGEWVNRCRQLYKRGKLDPQRRRVLESLPGWQWDLREHRWRCGLAALKDYVATHGHAHPSRRERFNRYPVGAWVCTQRAMHARGRLSPQRAAELSRLPGWRWRRARRTDSTSIAC
jgi:Helicase associated domain